MPARGAASPQPRATRQGQSVINITKPNLFRFQLERNSLTNTPFEATLVIATDNAGSDVYASFDWEEVTR